MGLSGLCSVNGDGVEMTLEEEEALFQRRVKQINRDCLATFLPYIKAVISILMIAATIVVSIVIYYAKDMHSDIRSLFTVSIENRATLINVQSTLDEHGEKILELQRRR